MASSQLIVGLHVHAIHLTEQQPTYILGQPTLSNKPAINENTPSQRRLSYAKCTGTNMVDIQLSLGIAQSKRSATISSVRSGDGVDKESFILPLTTETVFKISKLFKAKNQ